MCRFTPFCVAFTAITRAAIAERFAAPTAFCTRSSTTSTPSALAAARRASWGGTGHVSSDVSSGWDRGGGEADLQRVQHPGVADGGVAGGVVQS